MTLNELTRVAKALEAIHEFSGQPYSEIIDAWTGTVFSEEEAWELKSYFEDEHE